MALRSGRGDVAFTTGRGDAATGDLAKVSADLAAGGSTCVSFALSTGFSPRTPERGRVGDPASSRRGEGSSTRCEGDTNSLAVMGEFPVGVTRVGLSTSIMVVTVRAGIEMADGILRAGEWDGFDTALGGDSYRAFCS